MSKQSSLREELKASIMTPWFNQIATTTTTQATNTISVKEELVDAILDTLLAALPDYKDNAYHQWLPVNFKPIDNDQSNGADAGFNEGIERVRTLLTEAKKESI